MISSTASWQFVMGPEIRTAIAEVWFQYNQDFNSSHPALDSRHLSNLYQYFNDGSEIFAFNSHCACVLRPDGIGRWSTFLPSQACVGSDIVSPELQSADSVSLVRSLLTELPGRSTLLSLRKQDMKLSQITAHSPNPFVTVSTYGVTTNVDLAGDFDSFWRQRHKSVRQRINRTIRRLEEDRVSVSLRELMDIGDMHRAVLDHGRLELTGWKRNTGTAIDGFNLQSRYYVALMEAFAASNQAIVYQLMLNDKIAASLLTIFAADIMIVLKTAYNSRYSKFSPGRFLDYLMYRSAFENPDIRLIENYTSSTSTDRKWCTGFRSILDVDVFQSRILRSIAISSRKFRRRWKKTASKES